jgi:flagellar basal-body rod protein FlgB
MNTSGIPLFQLLTGRMSWLSSRQAVLAENISNADTPNYVAQDLKPLDFESLVNASDASSLETTNPRHIRISADPASAPQPVPAGQADGTAGKAVSLEQEMIKLSDTQLQYQTVTNLYQKAVSMFRTALGSSQQ